MRGTAQLARDLERLRATLRARKRPEPSPEAISRFDWYGPPSEVHPRARDNQRPPAGEWRTWFLCAGRAFGKTRSAAEWIRDLVESGKARRLHLVGATAADVRDTMILGESGLLTISPPWSRPTYEPSKRRLTWPNGATALLFSAEEPDRLRGPQAEYAWADEIAAWARPATWDNLLMGLRLGTDPRVCVSSTPKPTRLVRSLIADPGTAIVKGTTYDNRANLPAAFFDRIVATYAGTRLGLQEIEAELLEVSEGVIFTSFDTAKHVTEAAEFDPRFPVHLAIDCGVSKHTGGVFFQVRPIDQHRSRVNVFGEFHSEGLYSEAAAKAIRATSDALPSRGRLDTVRLDPAASATTGIGPAAFGVYEAIFGSRVTARWPLRRVADGIDMIELLLDQRGLAIHPRCVRLRDAFLNYLRRPGRNGEWLDAPMDPCHPHEDLLDALRGGVVDKFPDGLRAAPSRLAQIHVTQIY